MKELVKNLHAIGAIKFGEFVLKSGKKSPYYIDLRVLPSYPKVLEKVGKVMSKMIKRSEEKPTRLCGIPAAGLALANVIGIKTGIPVCYTRKEPIIYKDLANQFKRFIEEKKYSEDKIPGIEEAIKTIEELSGLKTHGITRYVDGDLQDGDKIAIIDDLITTAESKLEARDLIMLEAKRRNIKVDFAGVYVFLDREQGGKEALEKEGLKLYSVVTIREFAKYLLESGILSSQMYELITNYTIAERRALGLE
jgi:orotate phosphoribosyltransferase